MKYKKLYWKIEQYLYGKRATVGEIASHFEEPSSKIQKVLNKMVKDGIISESNGKYCDYNFVYFC